MDNNKGEQMGGARPYRRFGALSSSVNPNEVSKTIEGAFKGIGGLLAFWGATSVAGDTVNLGEQIGQIVTLGYALFGFCETAFGLIRKIAVNLQRMWAVRSVSED